MNGLSGSRQISSLYCHQAEAVSALAEGSHVIGELFIHWCFSFFARSMNHKKSVYTNGFWKEYNLSGG